MPITIAKLKWAVAGVALCLGFLACSSEDGGDAHSGSSGGLGGVASSGGNGGSGGEAGGATGGDAGKPDGGGGDGGTSDGGDPCAPENGGCGVDLTGSVYIVDSSSPCQDNCDGKSPATAWKTLAEAEAQVTESGADLCLMAGSVFEDDTLQIDWGGDATDRAIVGTCYAAPDGLFWWWEGPTPRVSVKAEINGTFDQACIDAGYATCNPEGPGHVPSNTAMGLAQISTSFVTLRAVKLLDSRGRGVRFDGTKQSHNHLIELEVKNLYGSNFFHLGPPPSTRHIVRDNVFMNAGYRYSTTWNVGNGVVGGSCFQFSRGTHADKTEPAYNIFEGNVLGNCTGEIGFLDSSHHIIRGNVFFNARNTGIYLDNVAHSVVEWNITFLARDNCNVAENFGGPNGCGPSTNGRSAQGGARWQLEDYPAGCTSPAACSATSDSDDNVVRHNLYVWGEEGWGASMEPQTNAGNVLTIGKYFLHNTVYNASIRAWRERISPLQQLQSGMLVANNVFVGSATANGANCTNTADSPSYQANVWDETAASLDDDCQAPGDEYGQVPGFVSPDVNGPPALSERPTFAKYAIDSGAGSGSSADLTAAVIAEIEPDCSDFPQLGDLDPTHGPEVTWAPTCANWRKQAYYDHQGKPRGASSDKGF